MNDWINTDKMFDAYWIEEKISEDSYSIIAWGNNYEELDEKMFDLRGGIFNLVGVKWSGSNIEKEVLASRFHLE